MGKSGALLLWIVVAIHGICAAPGAAAQIGSPGTAGQQPSSPSSGGIGIRLLDPPEETSDRRARIYVVDHVRPGTGFSRRLEVANTTAVPQRVALYSAAAGIHHETFTFAPDRTRNELSSWISLDRPEVALPAQSRTVVSARFDVPAHAVTGERYAVIWAEVTSTPPGPAGNLRLVSRVGVRVYLHVGPGAEPAAELRIESLTPGRDAQGRLQVRAVVHNVGLRAVEVNGHLTLTDERAGSTGALAPVGRDTTLAPGAAAPIVTVFDKDLPEGPWKVHLALESGRSATTKAMTFPSEEGSWGPSAQLEPTFPWNLVLGGAALAIAGLAAAVRLVRPHLPGSWEGSPRPSRLAARRRRYRGNRHKAATPACRGYGRR